MSSQCRAEQNEVKQTASSSFVSAPLKDLFYGALPLLHAMYCINLCVTSMGNMNYKAANSTFVGMRRDRWITKKRGEA